MHDHQTKRIPNQGCRRSVLWLMAVTVVLILLTRMVTLTYNRQLHPDEHVFYLSANSLVNSIVHPGMEFVENKEYPEGAYYFHAVVQFMGKVARKLFGVEEGKGLQHCGRVSSVFYFAAAVCMGMRLLWRYLRKSKSSLILYGLTMCFSLFFIEQSRYGTGDMITLMLLMLLLNLTAQAVESGGKKRWWFASFFVCGILGAVKYPQLVFVLIPLTAFLSQRKTGKTGQLALYLLAMVCGFFLFSPKTMLDPAYILRVIQREGQAYSGTPHEAGGTANHLAVLLVYLLLYSDFPLLPVFALGGLAVQVINFFRKRGAAQSREGTTLLFQVIVPGVCLFFFAYNLFVPLLFFRTYTPFFGILTVYTAAAADWLFLSSKRGRTAVMLLTACLVLRGCGLIWVFSDDSKIQDKMSAMIADAVDDTWSETWYTCLFAFQFQNPEGIEEHASPYLGDLIARNEGMEIQPGQLIITGAWEFYMGQEYLLPPPPGNGQDIACWNEFKEANKDYFVGQLYPDYYYYLFGGWLRGGTLSQYELPCHYIYYRGK